MSQLVPHTKNKECSYLPPFPLVFLYWEFGVVGRGAAGGEVIDTMGQSLGVKLLYCTLALCGGTGCLSKFPYSKGTFNLFNFSQTLMLFLPGPI